MFVIDAIPRKGSDANWLSSKDTDLPTEITLPNHLARYAGRPMGSRILWSSNFPRRDTRPNFPCRDVLEHHRSHANDCTRTDGKHLPDQRALAEIRALADGDGTAERRPSGKGHAIGNLVVVGDQDVRHRDDVRADPKRRRNHGAREQHRTRPENAALRHA